MINIKHGKRNTTRGELKTMDDRKREKHESFGLLQISRTTCSPPTNVFGSSIKTGNPIMLRISKGEKIRDLNREWYFDYEQIIEVEMSPSQFAEAITTLNAGVGVPVTIRRVQRKQMERCPDESINELFNEEFTKDIKGASKQLTELKVVAENILTQKGGLKAAEKKELLARIYKVEQDVRANMPFVHKQFARAMDKTVQQGKAEIESFMSNAVQKIGLDNMKDMPKLLGKDEQA